MYTLVLGPPLGGIGWARGWLDLRVWVLLGVGKA